MNITAAAASSRRRRNTGQRPREARILLDERSLGRVTTPATGRAPVPRGAGRPAGHPSRPDQMTGAAAARPTPSYGVAPETAHGDQGLMRSVLICDDRAAVRLELSKTLRLGASGPVLGVPDGDALLDAYENGARDQVLIGVHSGSTVGIHAVTLLLETHPDAAPFLFGSMNDIDLLADAYCRGAGGLLLWEPGAQWPLTL